MIDPGIDGLSRGNNLGGIMRGLEPLKFLPLNIRYPGALVTILMGRHFDYPGCHGMVRGVTKRRKSVMDPLAGRNGNCFILTVGGLAQEAL